ncbi:MAG TPA: hypothetical protein VGS62_04030 [Streptosporangiaceae bacterium]|nr:hypothetical protein [Streptosporangiaceae bacterium]
MTTAGQRSRVTAPGTVLTKPDQDKATYIDTHDKGWNIHLANLQDHVIR